MFPTLDMRTVLFFGVVAAALEALVMAPTWIRSRSRFPGTGLWLTHFMMRSLALLLMFFRGSIPDFLSIIVGNAVSIASLPVLYLGLQKFLGRRGRQLHNYVVLVLFVSVHAYFTYVQPDLVVRTVNYAAASVFFLAQAAWLSLRSADPEARVWSRTVGAVLSALVVVLVARAAVMLAGPTYSDLLQSGTFNASNVLAEITLWIGFTFALLLMINRRLVTNLENDIVERVAAQESLQMSEEKFKVAFRNVPDAISITSFEDGRVLEVNPGFFEMLGLEENDVLGKTSAELNVWDDPEDRDRYVRRIAENGSALNMHFVMRRASGERFHTVLSGERVNINGEDCILSLVHDDTERQRTQEEILQLNAGLEARVRERTLELVKMNEELIEANRAKSDFLTSMSHELRTPLNSVIGFSGILLSGMAGPLNEEQTVQIGMVNASGKHLLALVDEVLDLSKIELGRTKPKFERFDALQLSEGTLEMLRPIADAKTIALEFTYESEVGQLDSDPRFVSQILTNLLANAVKFTDAGSITLDVKSDEDYVVFAVTDTGRGFPEDDLPKVMERFFQAQPMVEAKNEGAGLGLAISARLAEMLEATLEVTSEVGVGSVFTLRVPRRRDSGDA